MNFKNLAMWGIIVILTIGLYNMFKNPQGNIGQKNKIIFSQFWLKLKMEELLKLRYKERI